MSSHYTTVNHNYIIVNNIFNDCIINLCGFRFFWDTLYIYIGYVCLVVWSPAKYVPPPSDKSLKEALLICVKSLTKLTSINHLFSFLKVSLKLGIYPCEILTSHRNCDNFVTSDKI